MVQKGYFSVQMVNAESMIPFQEHNIVQHNNNHNNNGNNNYNNHNDHNNCCCYVEVEPHAEYWIRVQANVPDIEYYYCSLHVDDKCLGYSRGLGRNQPRDLGVASRIGNVVTQKTFMLSSLKVEQQQQKQQQLQQKQQQQQTERTTTAAAAPSSPLMANFWMGTIQAEFHEARAIIGQNHRNYYNKAASRKLADIHNQWNGGNISTADVATTSAINNNNNGGDNHDADGSNTKAVNSKIGTKSEVCKAHTSSSRFQVGRLLETVKLYYCTALGLIHVGVLPKPESWAYHRMRFPALKDNNKDKDNNNDNKNVRRGRRGHRANSILQPQIVTKKMLGQNGDVLEEKTYELFDLNDDNDDDDDDDDNSDDDDDDDECCIADDDNNNNNNNDNKNATGNNIMDDDKNKNNNKDCGEKGNHGGNDDDDADKSNADVDLLPNMIPLLVVVAQEKEKEEGCRAATTAPPGGAAVATPVRLSQQEKDGSSNNNNNAGGDDDNKVGHITGRKFVDASLLLSLERTSGNHSSLLYADVMDDDNDDETIHDDDDDDDDESTSHKEKKSKTDNIQS